MQVRRLKTDDSLHSLLRYGSPEFPFEYYKDDLEHYDQHMIQWHWHHSLECTFVSSGAVLCKIFSEHHVLNEGDALFINSGAIHSFESKGCGQIKNVLFAPEFIAPKDSRIYRTYVAPILDSALTHYVIRGQDNEESKLIGSILTCCRDAEEPGTPMQELKLQGDINQLWQALFPRLELEQKKISHQSRLAQSRVHLMLNYIHEHYHEKILLEDIAAAANISKREALRCFSLCIQTTPVQYLNDYRLQCAETMLLQTTAPITAVALESGFDNAGYFCKVFKKKYGVTPSLYRRRTKPYLP